MDPFFDSKKQREAARVKTSTIKGFMDIDTFPEIENFQKLPHQVIVKGGAWKFDAKENAHELRGIVVNNSGSSIKDIRVNVVVFDGKGIPLLNTSAPCDPEVLNQGGVGAFLLTLKNCSKTIAKYHLFSNWNFNESK